MHKRERKWIKKKQLWRYASLRFVAEERIWNSHCLVTHSYLYSLTRVQQNIFSLLNSRVGSPRPFDHQCYSVRGIDWEEETNKDRVFQPWQNRFIGMHQERSVLGCLLLLYRILFVFGRAMRPGCQVTSVVHQKNPKTLQTRVLSVYPDETFPKYRKKLYFYMETYRQRRAEWNTWGVSRSVTVWFERVAQRQGLIHLRPD